MYLVLLLFGFTVGIYGDCPCDLTADRGPCHESFQRYFYNDKTKKCEPFLYGGCKGNANNFQTIKACEKVCKRDKCDLEVDSGPCRAKIPKYYYNKQNNICVKFFYGGCQGNANNFATIDACRKSCQKSRCTFDADTGPCSNKLIRYYYNCKTNKCSTFIYGGCKGNSNNFLTLDACKKKCKKNTCTMPVEKGPCKGKLPRYYYSIDTNKCTKFSYGGCKGNANNFITLDSCKRACKKSRCILPVKAGQCLKHIKRYYYNSETRKCTAFIYRGCQGNTNNFKTITDCQKVCATHQCSLPADVGLCRKFTPRYYYDIKKLQCFKFQYGGCQGNSNNFHTLQSCKATCLQKKCP